LFHIQNPTPKEVVTVNALLSGSTASTLEKTEKCLEKGFRSFKLKVGRKSIPEDIITVQQVKKRISDSAILRLDANRAWSIDEATTFIRGLGKIQIDYIEEPVKSLALLKSLLASSLDNLHVALDESLAEIDPDGLEPFSPAKAMILKPSLLGIERTFQFAAAAKARQITPVISATFESSIGLHVLARLAAAINTKDVPAGLDTQDWFAYDLLETPLNALDGIIRIPDLPDPTKTIRQELLASCTHV
jgi:O-succinylbenzoate synthase